MSRTKLVCSHSICLSIMFVVYIHIRTIYIRSHRTLVVSLRWRHFFFYKNIFQRNAELHLTINNKETYAVSRRSETKQERPSHGSAVSCGYPHTLKMYREDGHFIQRSVLGSKEKNFCFIASFRSISMN